MLEGKYSYRKQWKNKAKWQKEEEALTVRLYSKLEQQH